nr:polyprotein [Xinyang flavivirus]
MAGKSPPKRSKAALGPKVTQRKMSASQVLMLIISKLMSMLHGWKLPGVTRRKWATVPQAALMRGLKTVRNAVTGLMREATGRRRQRRGWTPMPWKYWVLLALCGGTFAARATMRGEHVVLNVTRWDVGQLMSVAGGTCIVLASDVGTWCERNIEYGCPSLDLNVDPVDVDCYCRNVTGVRVTYGQCNSGGPRIVERSLSVTPPSQAMLTGHPSVWMSRTQLESQLTRAENWALRHPLYVVCLAGLVMGMTRSWMARVALFVILVMLGPAYGTQCLGIESRDFVQGQSGGTWVDVVLEKGACVTIMAEGKPSIDIWLKDIYEEDPAKERIYCMEPTQGETRINARCPGTAGATLTEEGQTDWYCKRSMVARGWGNGCGFFGPGPVIGCVRVTCPSKELVGYVLDQTKLTYAVGVEAHAAVGNTTVENQNKQERRFTAVAESQVFMLGEYGATTLQCRTSAAVDVSNMVIAELKGETWIVHKDWFRDLPYPWKYEGGQWNGMDHMIHWDPPSAEKVTVALLGDQTGALKTTMTGQVRAAVTNEGGKKQFHPSGGHVTCKVKLNELKLKGITYSMCDNKFAWEKHPTATTHGTVVMTVNYAGKVKPCRIAVTAVAHDGDTRNIATQVTANPIVPSGAGADHSILIELMVPPGDCIIRVGEATYRWFQAGSTLGKMAETTMKGARRMVLLGDTAWDFGSVGGILRSVGKGIHQVFGGIFHMIFGGMGFISKLIIGGVLIWLGLQAHNMTLSLCFLAVGGLIATMALGVGADMACGLDFERMEFRCGQAVVVWRDTPGWVEGYSMHPEEPGRLAAMVKRAWHDGVCGVVPVGRLEHGMWKSVEAELNAVLDENAVPLSVVVDSEPGGFYEKGTLRLPSPEETLDHSWTEWGKSFLSSTPRKPAAFLVGRSGMDECPLTRRAWNGFRVSDFGVGLTKTYTYLEAHNNGPFCDTGLMGAAVKNDYAVHADSGMWMKSVLNGTNTTIVELDLLDVKRCLWPAAYAIDNAGVKESRMFMPKEYAGPVSKYNVIPGYAVQDKGPWNKAPLRVERGECPGTSVKVNSTCGKRGPSMRSTTESGSVIPNWCCRTCELPPVRFVTKAHCWYAMEIRPVRPGEGYVAAWVEAASGEETIMAWPFGLVAVMLFLQMAIRYGRLSGHRVVWLGLVLLFGIVSHVFTLEDVLRVMLAIGVLWKEGVGQEASQALLLEAVFKVRPALLVAFAWKKHWNSGSTTALLLALTFVQAALGGIELPDAFDALGLMGLAFAAVAHETSFHTGLCIMSLMGSRLSIMAVAAQCTAALLALSGWRRALKDSGARRGASVALGAVTFYGVGGFSTGFAFLTWVVLSRLRGSRRAAIGDGVAVLGLFLMGVKVACSDDGAPLVPVLAGLFVLLAVGMASTDRHLYIEKAGEVRWDPQAVAQGATLNRAVKRDRHGFMSLCEEPGSDDNLQLTILGLTALAGGFHWAAAVVGIVCWMAWNMLPRPRSQRADLMGPGPRVELGQPRTRPLEDGVYRVMSPGHLWGAKQAGAAVAVQGVLHTMFHVTRGAVVTTEDGYLVPGDADPERDLITYGGTWKIGAKWEQGEEVQLIAASPGRPVTNISTIPGTFTLTTGERLGAVNLDCPSGTSGSPIVNSAGVVIGLYGNGIITGEGVYVSAISSKEPDESVIGEWLTERGRTWMSAGTRECIQAAPGTGKTRVLLPRMVEQCVAERKRTLVLAPTRVVLREMCDALKGVPKNVQTSGDMREVAGGLVTLMCHATFAKIMLTPQARKNYEVVIMDEAHFLDPGSIATRGYWEAMAHGNQCAFIMMSATPPGYEDTAFPLSVGEIIDEVAEIPMDRWTQGHEWITEFEGKTAWFVPTIEVGKRIAACLKQTYNKKVITLNRKNYEINYPQIRRGDFDFVITTDIAEMGANLGVDRVIDPRLTRKPLLVEDMVVMSENIPVPTASAVQRRGRVGRRPHTNSEYRYQGGTSERMEDWVCWTEAQIYLDNFQTPRGVRAELCEAESRFRRHAVGEFTLRHERRKEMVKFLDRVPGMTLWLAWQLTQRGMTADNSDWLFTGPPSQAALDRDGNTRVINTALGPKEVKPVIRDDRLINDQEKLDQLDMFFRKSASDVLEALMRVPAHLTRSIPEAADTLTMLMNAEPGSRAFKQAQRMGPEAVELLALVGVCALLTGGMAFVAMARTAGNRLTLGALGVATTTAFMYWGGFSWGHMAGVVMSASVFLLVVVPEPGSQRGVLDNQLAYVLIGLALLVGVVYCNEAGLLERTKRDLFGGHRELAVDVPQWMPSFEIKVDVPVVWGLYAGLASILTPWLLHMAEQAGAVAAAGAISHSGGALNLLSAGFPFVLATPETWVVLFSTAWHMSFASASMALMCCVLHWWVVLPGAQANICRRVLRTVHAALAKTPMVDGLSTFDFPDVPKLEPSMEKRLAGWILVLLSVVSVACDRTSMNVVLALILGMVGLQQAMAIEGWGLWGPGQACGLAITVWKHDPLGLIPVLCRLWFIQGDSRRGNAAVGLTLGEVWKRRLNKLSKTQFYEYRTSGIIEVDRSEARKALRRGETNHGHPVSRGAAKLHWLVERGFVEPSGWVVDLGCGRGGWCQVTAGIQAVTRVEGYTLGTGGHEKPIVTECYGHNLIAFKDKVDVMKMEPTVCDTVLCDIGESSSNLEIEAGRTMAVLNMFTRWLEKNPRAQFCCKILTPYHPEVLAVLETEVRNYGGGLIRVPLSRNSSHEMYWVSGVRNKPARAINTLSSMLLARFARTEKTELIEEIWLGTGVRHTVSSAEPDDMAAIEGRLERLRRAYSCSWREDAQHPYRYWNYHGSYVGAQRGSAASLVNGIVKLLSWPWNTREDVTCMGMTDTTPFGQQRVFREKVDTKVPEPGPGTRRAMAIVAEWLWARALTKKTPRLCSREEFVRKVHSHAAIGAWDPAMGSWKTAAEAVMDPEFWDVVDEEREQHKAGKCSMCVYNMMGKREKKPSKFGKARGSRAIWYMWLGSRFLEFEALGFLNEDHWMDRETSGAGVEGAGLHSLGYVLRSLDSLGGGEFYADDTAGWDTRVSNADLEDEEQILCHMTPEHRRLAEPIMKLAYHNKVALVARRANDGVVVTDVITRRDQRGSGQVVTYALNTWTNIKVQLIRMAEADGVLGPDAVARCPERALRGWLSDTGERALGRMAVSGDDCVVKSFGPTFSTALHMLNDMGKVRKDLAEWEPSSGYARWEDVPFCSHHFHEVRLRDGRDLVVPCRDQDELIGRARIAPGAGWGMAEVACLAKAYAQMWLLMYPHRRDLRLLALAICSAVPVGWVPSGRTTWSVHATREWMTTDDMLAVWNRVWIVDNPWMADKTPVTAWSDVPYLPKSLDLGCGSLIGRTSRASWARSVRDSILKIRSTLGPERYVDYLGAMGRYVAPQSCYVTELM